MPYLIQGTAEQLYSAFGLNMFLQNNSSFDDVEKDLFRNYFLGSYDQAEQHLSHWTNLSQEQAQYYSQGDMTAGKLPFFMNPDDTYFPFKKKDETYKEHQKNIYKNHFAFVSDRGEPCGLSICYRTDDPTQWMIGLVKNTNLIPKEKTVFILTSFDLKPNMKVVPKGVVSSSVNPTKNPMLDQIAFNFLKGFIQTAINSSTGEIDLKSARLELLIRSLTNTEKKGPLVDPVNLDDIIPARLFAENVALDLILKFQIPLSFALLKECLEKTSELQKQIQQINQEDNPKIVENFLRMVITFHGEKVLKEHELFLQEQVFSKVSDAFTWNDQQIKLIPYLLKQNYPLDLFQLILSDADYYDSLLLLSELNLTQNIPALFRHPRKLEELKLINQLTQCGFKKKAVLILWARTNLSSDEYRAIVEATKNYPLFEETFIALEQNKKLSIKDLQALALNPLEHQKKSIVHHFAEQFSEYHLKKTDLNKLSLVELNSVINSLNSLKEAHIQLAGYYSLVLNKDQKGQLFRLFLQKLAFVSNPAYRTELTELLYSGVTKDAQTLNSEIQKLSDTKLINLAKELHERFVCAQQLQKLGFNDDIITLATEHEVNQPGLLGKYPCLDVLLKASASHSSANIKDYLQSCISPTHAFYDEIELIRFTDNPVVNENLLEMAIVFYEEQVLEKHSTFLRQHVFSKVTSDFKWDDTQIQLIPFLLKKEYELDQFQLILSDKVNYEAVSFLRQRQVGLTQNVSDFLRIPEKLQQLTYISGLESEQHKQLCLILWAKLDVADYNLQNIVTALETYPLLTKTLLDLDLAQTITAKDLVKLALNPNKHQPKSMVHYFAGEFKQHHLYEDTVKQLDPKDWGALTDTFIMLKNTKTDLPGIFELAIGADSAGQIMRLFIPRLNAMEDATRATLIGLIYTGIKKGPVSQANMISQMKDKALTALAKEVHEQFVCVQQLQKLRFDTEIIRLAAHSSDEKANRFRQVILGVEEQCEGVHEILRQSSADAGKAKDWQNESSEYRKKLYQIAFQGLQEAPSELRTQNIHQSLRDAEESILAIVDPKETSLVRKILIAIANIFITVFTLGFANDAKYKKTGNYWFFNQTESGEKVRALNKNVLATVLPDPALECIN